MADGTDDRIDDPVVRGWVVLRSASSCVVVGWQV